MIDTAKSEWSNWIEATSGKIKPDPIVDFYTRFSSKLDELISYRYPEDYIVISMAFVSGKRSQHFA